MHPVRRGQLYKPNPVEAVGMTFEEIRFIMDRTVAFLGDFFVGRGDVEQLGRPGKGRQGLAARWRRSASWR